MDRWTGSRWNVGVGLADGIRQRSRLVYGSSPCVIQDDRWNMEQSNREIPASYRNSRGIPDLHRLELVDTGDTCGLSAARHASGQSDREWSERPLVQLGMDVDSWTAEWAGLRHPWHSSGVGCN